MRGKGQFRKGKGQEFSLKGKGKEIPSKELWKRDIRSSLRRFLWVMTTAPWEEKINVGKGRLAPCGIPVSSSCSCLLSLL